MPPARRAFFVRTAIMGFTVRELTFAIAILVVFVVSFIQCRYLY